VTQSSGSYGAPHPFSTDIPMLERFRAKACPGLDPGWIPVRVKKTRQNKNLEPGSDSIGTGKALALSCGATCALFPHRTEADMTESVYKVIELIGTSNESWEKAAAAAVERAGKTLRDLRVAEVVKLDLQLDAKGKIEAYRAKLNVSFKFEGD
jgi:dodecin